MAGWLRVCVFVGHALASQIRSRNVVQNGIVRVREVCRRGAHFACSCSCATHDNRVGHCVCTRWTLGSIPEVTAIKLSMPNIHYIPFHHLSNLGHEFADDIYMPTNEPAGAIQATVRDVRVRVCVVCVCAMFCRTSRNAMQVAKPGKLRSKL